MADDLLGVLVNLLHPRGRRPVLERQVLRPKRQRRVHLPAVVIDGHPLPAEELAVVEALQRPDAGFGQFPLIDMLPQPLAECRHAVGTEAPPAPLGAGCARIVIDVEALDVRRRRHSHLVAQELAIARGIRAEPVGRMSLVLVIPQPRDQDPLAIECQADRLLETLIKVDHLREGRPEGQARAVAHVPLVGRVDPVQEVLARAVRVLPDLPPPAHHGPAIGVVELAVLGAHEDHVRVLHLRVLRRADNRQDRQHRASDGRPLHQRSLPLLALHPETVRRLLEDDSEDAPQ